MIRGLIFTSDIKRVRNDLMVTRLCLELKEVYVLLVCPLVDEALAPLLLRDYLRTLGFIFQKRGSDHLICDTLSWTHFGAWFPRSEG